MSAHAGSRAEGHEPEGLGGRSVDDLPDVQSHPLTQQRELVHQCDVDVAKDVLQQLRELGGVGRGELVDGVVDAPKQPCRAGSRSGRQPADESGHVPSGAGRVARVDALRCKREIEVSVGAQAGFLEGRAEGARRGSRVGGRLQNDELASSKAASDQPSRTQDRPEVGILGVRDRGWHANHEDVRLRKVGDVGGGDRQPVAQRVRQAVAIDVVDGRVPGIELVDAPPVRVDPGDVESGLRECQRERQAHITEPDDRDLLVLAHATSDL